LEKIENYLCCVQFEAVNSLATTPLAPQPPFKSIQSCQCPLAACACMQKSTLLP